MDAVATLQLVENCVADGLRIGSQVRIPETQRLDAARLQEFFPFRIMLALARKTVLTTVQFHIQPGFLTIEIQRMFRGNSPPANDGGFIYRLARYGACAMVKKLCSQLAIPCP